MIPSKRKVVPNKPSKVEKQSFLTVTRSDTEFVADVKGAHEVFALVVKALVVEGKETPVVDVPEKIRPLLEQFRDITSEDLPDNLPPLRDEEEQKNQAEKLKEEVKLMFAKSMEVLSKLELVDILMKLGLSILFEKEILEALDSIATPIKINYHTLEADLYATAL
ncbi:hypothetical protein LWI29_008538 [Acer saccharum]|uniref:Terpene synthase N-terminal domain-containing protein n=1 Tax=Acer saccharum TaxID=4024 RepID=A0AA39SWX9_ACESA|nr:hypothetical protein LWI29_008538 [Acer saccharum]